MDRALATAPIRAEKRSPRTFMFYPLRNTERSILLDPASCDQGQSTRSPVGRNRPSVCRIYGRFIDTPKIRCRLVLLAQRWQPIHQPINVCFCQSNNRYRGRTRPAFSCQKSLTGMRGFPLPTRSISVNSLLNIVCWRCWKTVLRAYKRPVGSRQSIAKLASRRPFARLQSWLMARGELTWSLSAKVMSCVSDRPSGAGTICWANWPSSPQTSWQRAVAKALKVSARHYVSIHAPYGANLEEVTPLPNEFYPPEGGGFKPGSVFDETEVHA
ncbi:hypothetical protein M2244_000877 [Rhodoferax antarcticus]|nr:hypothetical protein [Rhodoferax antarcticus]